ncbi:MAG: hypothetical protein U5K30_00080 [Acidimicrobiales bacterium]|nr:hypothetical protein [Acidimicrobiales bacterium]
MDREGLRLDTELLDAELPDPRFADESYLEWLYLRNPHGTAYADSIDDDGLRVAHYAFVPQQYRNEAGPARFAFSLNAVTRSGIQRKGYFTKLSRGLFERAAADGVRVIVGVSNENSTPPVVEKLDWRLYCGLPVVVAARPLRGVSGWRSVDVDDAYLDSARFVDDADGLDHAEAHGWTNRYTVDHLRWRLASPNGPGFSVHVGPDLVAVSTRSSFGPVPMAVLLKILPRGRPSAVFDGRDALAAVCRHHRTPACVYAGWNRWVRLRGITPPRRLLPAPLNLIVKSLDPEIDQDALVLDTFEFLDMDAY